MWRFGQDEQGLQQLGAFRLRIPLCVLLHEFLPVGSGEPFKCPSLLGAPVHTQGVLLCSPGSAGLEGRWPSAGGCSIAPVRCRSRVFLLITLLICQCSVPQKEHFCCCALHQGCTFILISSSGGNRSIFIALLSLR